MWIWLIPFLPRSRNYDTYNTGGIDICNGRHTHIRRQPGTDTKRELQLSSRPHISLSLTNPYSSKTNAKGELALLVTEIETGSSHSPVQWSESNSLFDRNTQRPKVKTEIER